VAFFDPVYLAGTLVKRASLVNPNTISDLGVGIGSTVVVTKRGEIIPKIERVLPDGESVERSVDLPQICGVCGSALVNEGTRLYCPNMQCPKRIHHRLEKWVQVLDIRDFGETLIRNIFYAGKVRSISDLYTLTREDLTPFFLADESIAKEKKSRGAEKVIQTLYAKTRVPLAVFVAGFDIEGIGETLVEKLVAAGFDTPEKLFAADIESISLINGFAETTARMLVEGLNVHKSEMRSLIENGIIHIEEARGAESPLYGRSFCFTGEMLKLKRSDAEKMVKNAGGSVKSAVTKDLSYLVTNDKTSGSAKNTRAAELGIAIISEEEFLKLL
jgi:DNA ligase (NAD+)